jgi:large subunit ribosomal protein L18e
MKKGTEIESLRRLIITLEKASRKNDANIWAKVAFYLKKPKRQRGEINLNRLNRIANDGDFLIVPGKVLGIGKASKKFKIAALSFSKTAIASLKKAGIEGISIEKIVAENPKGSNIRLII